MSTAVLALGSNLGDRLGHLRGAVGALGGMVVRVSGTYETPPWGDPDQPPYLNAAVLVRGPAYAVRRQRRQRPTPLPPPAGQVERHRLVRGAQRAEVVPAPDQPLQRRHQGRAVAASARGRPYRDAFDITRAQRDAAVNQPAVHEARVSHELRSGVRQGVDAAEAVLPVVVGHVVEDLEEQGAGGPGGRRVQVGGVSGDDMRHRAMMPPPFSDLVRRTVDQV